MPQLDSLAYVSEVLWLIVIFLSLYFLLLNVGLPNLHIVLKYRKFLLELNKKDILFVRKELYYSKLNFKKAIFIFCNNLKVMPELLFKKFDIYLQLYLGNLVNLFKTNSNKILYSKGFEGVFNKLRIISIISNINYIKNRDDISKKILN